jgi:transcription elongation factor GreB
MGIRYRPPRPKSSGYITPEGAHKLRTELEQLWLVERPRVTQEVADAAAQGDRSENAEYIYGKRRLREIDSRVRFLNKRLDDATIVTEPPTDRSRVFFGAWVEVEDEEGAPSRYRIVGADELDAERGSISIDSPMARALLGKREGDEVLVRRPKGDTTITITGVSYPPSGAAPAEPRPQLATPRDPTPPAAPPAAPRQLPPPSRAAKPPGQSRR